MASSSGPLAPSPSISNNNEFTSSTSFESFNNNNSNNNNDPNDDPTQKIRAAAEEQLKKQQQEKQQIQQLRKVRVEDDGDVDEDDEDMNEKSKKNRMSKKGHMSSSKYDYVKVRVWLEEHYYVLSRFIVSRILTVTKVNNEDAIRISLELKKRLVDRNLLDVSQQELETHLFHIMSTYGYAGKYIERYKMMTKFHHQRVPLLILIFGTGCTGKSTLATQLAERLNLPNVLQTDMVHELMCNVLSNVHSTPVWFRKLNREEFLSEYKKECEFIRRGLQDDIKKCFEEGKAIIIEGSHVDPSLYLELIEKCNMTGDEAPTQPSHTSSSSSSGLAAATPASSDSSSNNNNNNSRSATTTATTGSNDSVEAAKPSTAAGAIPAASKKSSEEGKKEGEEAAPAPAPAPAASQEKDGGGGSSSSSKGKMKGIIVPFLLSMNEDDHHLFIEHWLATRQSNPDLKGLGSSFSERVQNLFSNFELIQNYIFAQRHPNVQMVSVNLHSFQDTLDLLHQTVLNRIEEAYKHNKF